MTDCVPRCAEDYVEIAVRLGTDADYQRHVADRLRDASLVLFEDIDAVHEHERIFAELIDERGGRSRKDCGLAGN